MMDLQMMDCQMIDRIFLSQKNRREELQPTQSQSAPTEQQLR